MSLSKHVDGSDPLYFTKKFFVKKKNEVLSTVLSILSFKQAESVSVFGLRKKQRSSTDKTNSVSTQVYVFELEIILLEFFINIIVLSFRVSRLNLISC